jgi:aminopeptidase N
MIFKAPLLLAGLLAMTNMQSPVQAAEDPAAVSRKALPADLVDAHSWSNPYDVAVNHVDLDLTVDFAQKRLVGSVILTVERAPGAAANAPLFLDTRDLGVISVEAEGPGLPWAPVPYHLGNPAVAAGEEALFPTGVRSDGKPIHGTALRVDLPTEANRVRIGYRTDPTATALQWLEPSQTAGGQQPFLFTQSQAIHARSWIPLQDSPGVRVTYSATIHVPAGLKAVMSALGNFQEPGQGADGTFSFKLEQPIPSYLIALGVGDLAFRPLGARTGVYAEPSLVDKAAAEFADTEAMVEVTEKRFGPYRWGRYDLLVLPPSFPFGGMENPLLTFATPTILAGDKSLVSLVAHELAHSWSGNLVTNATWSDFWLNEGFTTYIENRIIEDVYGTDRAAMESVLGLQELREQLASLPEPDQLLVIDLRGRDPDEGVTLVPYEKGKSLLYALEQAVGREQFDPWIRSYFDSHAFQSIPSSEFLDDLRMNLLSKDAGAASKVDLDAWLHQPGLPAFPEPTSDRFSAVDKLATAWASGATAAAQIDPSSWTTQEWLHFLRALPADLPSARLAELDAAFHLTARQNAEIAAQWLEMSIKASYAPAYSRLEEFLTTVGRRKFIMPLYKALIAAPDGLSRAKAIYAKARPRYHPIAVESVDQLLGATESK